MVTPFSARTRFTAIGKVDLGLMGVFLAINASIGIWKWIEFYGDIGLLKNINRPSKSYFDSGIKFNLVPDYFEIFFPLYSSNGFEPTQSQYATKIRFIFSPRLKTLSSLFSRKWF